MDPRRLRVGEWLAGLSGALLLVSLFLHWYGPPGGAPKLTAWQSFAVIDVVLALAGAMGVALALVTAMHRTQAVPTALSALLVYVSVTALLLLLFRVASPPGHHLTREAGLWIGLVACIGLVAAAMTSLRDERFPRVVREQKRVAVRTLPTPPREGTGQGGS